MGFLRTNDCVFGCILISKDGKICLVQGRSTRKWSFPKGHPNQGESPFQCASRETTEETGIVIPWQTHRPVKLAIGYYYIIFVDEQYQPCSRDSREIIQVGWFSVNELTSIKGNVDVNAFLKRLAVTSEGEEQVWKLIRRRCNGFGFSQQSQHCTLLCPTVYPSFLDRLTV
jgi:NADH pyrophosphatase NudC (nudix superfamily)